MTYGPSFTTGLSILQRMYRTRNFVSPSDMVKGNTEANRSIAEGSSFPAMAN